MAAVVSLLAMGGHPFSGLPEALRKLRAKRGLTQRALADEAGISAANLSGYETGSTDMQVETLGRVLAALRYDVGDLAAELGQVPAAQVMTRQLDDLTQQMTSMLAELRDLSQTPAQR